MPKLKSSGAPKKLYWKRKNKKQTHHEKRVEEWERKGRTHVNCGARPMSQDMFASAIFKQQGLCSV